MEDVLVGRQPIFRADMGVLGYEVLFRNLENPAAAHFSDEDEATAQVILNSCTDIGLEPIVGPHPAFINFGRNFVLSDYCEAIPHQRIILEIANTIESDEQIISRLKELRARRYRIVLDDFISPYPTDVKLLQNADFIKIDVLKTPLDDIKKSIGLLKQFPVKLIAKRVETQEQFHLCKQMGFDFFQGYFFCRPQLVASRRTPTNRLSTVRLITRLNTPDIPIKQLEQIISQDVSLTYKLLRYINSAVYSLRAPVESIGHAVMLVGQQRLRIWASLILISGIDDRPSDLLATALIRARMCEDIAGKLSMKPPADRFFLAGLFSVLDAILDQPLQTIVYSLPLPEDVVDALLDRSGPIGKVMSAVIAYERHDWDRSQDEGLTFELLRKSYVEATLSILSTVFAEQASLTN